MRGFIGSLRTRLGRIAGIVVSLLVIAGFAFVMLQMATGGPIAHSLVSDDPTATVPLFQYQTPTPTPLDAPPTPTFFAPGNATPTHDRTRPGEPTPGFTVQSIPSASVDFGTDSGFPGLTTDTGSPVPQRYGWMWTARFILCDLCDHPSNIPFSVNGQHEVSPSYARSATPHRRRRPDPTAPACGPSSDPVYPGERCCAVDGARHRPTQSDQLPANFKALARSR